MKSKLIFGLLAIAITFIGCDDIPTFDEQLEIDKVVMEDYIADNGLVGEWTEQGVFYVMEDEGEGTEYPDVSSQIEIIYRGTLLDGTQFDSSQGFPVTFNVYQLIRGWQDGIQNFKKDSKGILIIPSGLGYGVRGVSGIPGNAVIRFDIELIDF